VKLTIIGLWGAYPKVNEASSGYLLEHNGFKLLIDCGSGVLSKMQNYVQPEKLDAVLISHYHTDHIADIGVLQHALLVKSYLIDLRKTLPIYGHTFDEEGFSKLTYSNYTKGIAYDPDKVLQIGPFTIHFLKTKHPVPCYAFRIEANDAVFVFTADSAYQPSFVEFCRNADLLLSECNFYGNMNGENAGHMNSFEVGKLAHEANVKQLILTHLPQFGDLQQLVTEAGEHYDGPIHLAKMGDVWNL
jgi:ribonuclease BN (tRNA processing enzyme)